MSMRFSMLAMTVLLAATVLTAACANRDRIRCNDDEAYADARTTGPLRVPDDLSVLDESEALRVPDEELGDPGPADGSCIELSPGFSESVTNRPSDDG